MSANLKNAFRSARLVYRAIESNDADQEWYHTQIQNDPVGFALGDSNLLRPQLRSRSDESLAGIQKSMLGVMICLPERESSGAGAGASEAEAETLTPIGVLCLDDENGSDYRHHHRLSVLRIAIVAAHQDKGYGAEAIRWARDWAFARANIHAISLGCVEYNDRGRHLYEKLGFVLEGRFRQCHFHEGRWWDVLLFSMLEDEWRALRDDNPHSC